MSIRARLALVVTAVMAIYAVAASGALYRVIEQRFTALEEAEAQKDLSRVRRALDHQVVRWGEFAWETSAWDATYRYVQNPYPEYLEELGHDQPRATGYHVLYMVDAEGAVQLSFLYDQDYNELDSLEGFPSGQWDPAHPLLQHDSPRSDVSGFLETPHGLLIVSARPITTSVMTGPFPGTMIMGRFITPDDVGTISQQVQVPFRFYPRGGGPVGEPFRTAAIAATVDKDALELDATYPDLYGVPAFAIEAYRNREFSEQAERLTMLAIVLIWGSALLALLTLGALLTGVIVRPLQRLTGRLAAIERNESLQLPAELKRTDEVGRLAREFDALAARLRADAEERDEAEAALREREERFRAIFDSAPDGILIIDPEIRIESANAAMQRQLRMSEEQLVGMRAEQLMGGDSETVEQVVGDVARQLAQTHYVAMGREYEAVRGDGTRYPAHVAVSEINVPGGQRFLAIVRDISELKAMHEEVARNQHMAAIGEMGAAIAHEVRNPLAGISSAVQLLNKNHGPDDPHKELYEEAYRNVRRVEQTMRLLLMFARQWKAHPRWCALDDLIGEVRQALDMDDPQSRVRLDTGDGDQAVRLFADPQLAHQVLANLIGNAAEAGADRVTVRVSGAEVDGETQVFVDDDGPGIAESLREAVFRPFYTTKEKGTGLGLGICRQIMDAHGGRIEVAPSPLGGVRFVLHFPKGEAEASPAAS